MKLCSSIGYDIEHDPAKLVEITRIILIRSPHSFHFGRGFFSTAPMLFSTEQNNVHTRVTPPGLKYLNKLILEMVEQLLARKKFTHWIY